jgi:hypothetical protein
MPNSKNEIVDVAGLKRISFKASGFIDLQIGVISRTPLLEPYVQSL